MIALAEQSPTRSSALDLLRRGIRLVAPRLVVNVALGAAVVLSLIAVCCGVGAISAPWFMAELLAVQLAEAYGRRLLRTKGWIAATSVLLAAVLLVASSAWLTTLAFGTQPQSDAAVGGSWITLLPQLYGFLIAVTTTVIALAVVIPLFYAPVILLDQGGNVGGALLESVRLVIEGGFTRHLWLSFVSHTLQLSPLLLALLFAATFLQTSAIPAALLLASPLLSLSLPLGQAMFVAAYVDVRPNITNPRRTRLGGRPPRRLVIAMLVCVLTPVASLFAFGGSLVRPSHLAAGDPSLGTLIADRAVTSGAATRIYPPDTTLEIHATPKKVRVTAGDGGGAGSLPLRSTAAISRVRVRRVGEMFTITIEQGAQRHATRIDSAGVRHDDDLRSRLSDRAPLWATLFMLGTLLLTLALLGPPVYQLALVRRAYTFSGNDRPATTAIQEQHSKAVSQGWLACAALIPAIAATLYWAARAVLGV